MFLSSPISWILLLLFLIFEILGIVLITFGIRSKLHVAGKCGAALVPANCIELTTQDQMTGTVRRAGETVYQRGTKSGLYQYSYEGVRYTEQALLSTNFKKYMPVIGPCTIAISTKNPKKVYAPAGAAAGNILLFIGILFAVLPIVVMIPIFILFHSLGLLA